MSSAGVLFYPQGIVLTHERSVLVSPLCRARGLHDGTGDREKSGAGLLRQAGVKEPWAEMR